MTDELSLVVADDQTMLRTSLAALLDAEPDLRVVGEAADGAEAVELVAALRPDIALLDIRMPTMDGLEATRRICADPALAAVRVCVLTMFELDAYVIEALRAGASGFLLKDAEPDVLARALRHIHAGELALAPTVLQRVVARAIDPARPEPRPPEGLTPREVEVLTLVGRGFTNAEIEATLHISRGTLKTHIAHLLTKLSARDRTQLVIVAYESGLVGVDQPAGRPSDPRPSSGWGR